MQRAVAGADNGDFRSNLRKPNGSYRSEFHLANLLTDVSYSGFGERWPLRLVADYVHNNAAAAGTDTAYSIDVALGKTSAPGDWRFSYGYSMAEADAVLAAFSHDNISIATNYRLHALTGEYVLMPKTALGAVWYHYRPYDARYAGSNSPTDWLNRVRLYRMLSF